MANEYDERNNDMPKLNPAQQYRAICGPHLWRIEQTMKEHSNALKDHTVEIQKMSAKVFNGYGSQITMVEKKLDEEISYSRESHKELKSYLGAIAKFGATALILIFVALLGVLGSIWLMNAGIAPNEEQVYRGQLRIERIIPAEQAEEEEDEADDNGAEQR